MNRENTYCRHRDVGTEEREKREREERERESVSFFFFFHLKFVFVSNISPSLSIYILFE